MGLKPREVKALYLKDFNLMLTGYFRRQEAETNRTRHIMWSVMNFSGMGVTSPIAIEQIWPLAMDKEAEKRMITTLAMAVQLLKEFE